VGGINNGHCTLWPVGCVITTNPGWITWNMYKEYEMQLVNTYKAQSINFKIQTVDSLGAKNDFNNVMTLIVNCPDVQLG
jgi:hypothetical protein